jgi:hypothetical protein
MFVKILSLVICYDYGLEKHFHVYVSAYLCFPLSISMYVVVFSGCIASKGDGSCWEALQTGRYCVMLGDKVIITWFISYHWLFPIFFCALYLYELICFLILITDYSKISWVQNESYCSGSNVVTLRKFILDVFCGLSMTDQIILDISLTNFKIDLSNIFQNIFLVIGIH